MNIETRTYSDLTDVEKERAWRHALVEFFMQHGFSDVAGMVGDGARDRRLLVEYDRLTNFVKYACPILNATVLELAERARYGSFLDVQELSETLVGLHYEGHEKE